MDDGFPQHFHFTLAGGPQARLVEVRVMSRRSVEFYDFFEDSNQRALALVAAVPVEESGTVVLPVPVLGLSQAGLRPASLFAR